MPHYVIFKNLNLYGPGFTRWGVFTNIWPTDVLDRQTIGIYLNIRIAGYSLDIGEAPFGEGWTEAR
jgi:hypothetical protein